MSFDTHARESGAWRTGLLVYAKDGGSWRDVQEVWAKEGGTWRQVYVRSSPIATTIDGYWSQAYTEGGDKISYTFDDEDLIQGDWDTVGHASGTQRGTGLCGFRTSDIQAPFGSRDVVSACSFYAECKMQYTSNGIYMRAALRSGTGSSIPSTWAHAHGDSAVTDSVRLNPGETAGVSFGTTGGQRLFDGDRTAVQIHDFGDGTSTSAKELYRGGYSGVGNSDGALDPYLSMTVDYI